MLCVSMAAELSYQQTRCPTVTPGVQDLSWNPLARGCKAAEQAYMLCVSMAAEPQLATVTLPYGHKGQAEVGF